MTRNLLAIMVVCLAWCWWSSPIQADGDSPAETVRKALDKEITLDFVGGSLDEAVQHLSAWLLRAARLSAVATGTRPGDIVRT